MMEKRSTILARQKTKVEQRLRNIGELLTLRHGDDVIDQDTTES